MQTLRVRRRLRLLLWPTPGAPAQRLQGAATGATSKKFLFTITQEGKALISQLMCIVLAVETSARVSSRVQFLQSNAGSITNLWDFQEPVAQAVWLLT